MQAQDAFSIHSTLASCLFGHKTKYYPCHKYLTWSDNDWLGLKKIATSDTPHVNFPYSCQIQFWDHHSPQHHHHCPPHQTSAVKTNRNLFGHIIVWARHIVAYFHSKSSFSVLMQNHPDSCCMETGHPCPWLTSPLHRELWVQSSEFRIEFQTLRELWVSHLWHHLYAGVDWPLLYGGSLGQARPSVRVKI